MGYVRELMGQAAGCAGVVERWDSLVLERKMAVVPRK